MQPTDELQQRVKRNIKIDVKGCWVWQRTISKNGYGGAWLKTGYRQGINTSAHRVSYLAFKGEIPARYQIDHLCKVRSCVNPEHLEAVTPRENVMRSDAKFKEQMRRTHCPQGHEYTVENTYYRPSRAGGVCRNCKQCFYERNKARYELRKKIENATR